MITSKVNTKTIPQSPWITKGLLKSINVKNKLYKQYLLRSTGDHLVKFKTYRNKLNNLIRKSKREYYHKQFECTKNNIRQTWKTINGIIGRCKSVSQQSTFNPCSPEGFSRTYFPKGGCCNPLGLSILKVI